MYKDRSWEKHHWAHQALIPLLWWSTCQRDLWWILQFKQPDRNTGHTWAPEWSYQRWERSKEGFWAKTQWNFLLCHIIHKNLEATDQISWKFHEKLQIMKMVIKLMMYFLSVSLIDNLWSNYGSAGMFIEKENLPSEPAQSSSNHTDVPYVLNDIATCFTILVGIYFPSVTGRWDTTAPLSKMCRSDNIWEVYMLNRE